MIDRLIHRWLRVPYALHCHVTNSVGKTTATVLFVHGIGNSGPVWNSVVTKLPKDLRVVTVDLLGFGQSPRPSWVVYDVRTQARSVLATYLKLRLRGQVIVVGHSLGALVAVELAKRYPLLVRSLILVSPPFYQPHENEKRLFPRSDKILRSIYKTAHKHPDRFLRLTSVAMRYKLVNAVFNVNKENIDSYMSTLEAAIINQTTLSDAKKLKLPIRILHGTLDPIVVYRNLKDLERQKPNVGLAQVVASHEIAGRMIGATVKAIQCATIKPEVSKTSNNR